MSKLAPLAFVSALVCVASFGFFGKTGMAANAATPTSAEAQIQKVVAATTAFLNSLTTTERENVQFTFSAEKTAMAAKFSRAAMEGKQGGHGGAPAWASPGFVGEQYGRAVWSNYPVSDVPRPGLRLGNLGVAQRDAAMHLLRLALSSKGYQKILDIMGSDEALSKTGTPYCSGTACYTIGIFGQPSTTKPWMLEFGGHHLGLNLTMAGEHSVITPTLTGAQPAVYTSNGKTVRAFGRGE